MISIIYVFWMYVFVFAVIGWMRSWAKELLVAFSVILSLALTHVIEKYIPIAASLPKTDPSLFWVRTIILLVLVYFGYQTVVSIPHLAAKGRTEKLQDTLFGAFLGGLNGYLVAGSVLWYLYEVDSSFQKVVIQPPDQALQLQIQQMMMYMPPHLLGEPGIYFAIILAFVFVLVVYI